MGNKKGFTLIEILIVIVIIGILAVAFLPGLLGGPSKARDTQREADIKKISSILTNQAVSGEVFGGCINEDMPHGVGTLGELIKPESFGGKIPTDPSASIIGGCTKPGYLVIAGDKANSDNKYTLGVFAKVENKAKGNFDCAKLDGLDGTVAQPITDGWTLTPGNGGCLGILIQ